jgi:hypothetical protein
MWLLANCDCSGGTSQRQSAKYLDKRTFSVGLIPSKWPQERRGKRGRASHDLGNWRRVGDSSWSRGGILHGEYVCNQDNKEDNYGQFSGQADGYFSPKSGT